MLGNTQRRKRIHVRWKAMRGRTKRDRMDFYASTTLDRRYMYYQNVASVERAIFHLNFTTGYRDSGDDHQKSACHSIYRLVMEFLGFVFGVDFIRLKWYLHFHFVLSKKARKRHSLSYQIRMSYAKLLPRTFSQIQCVLLHS